MTGGDAGPQRPRVRLSRAQWVRLVIVGILVLFATARVVPDCVRVFMPLGVFGYVTDTKGVVAQVATMVPRGSDRIEVGDLIRIDRIKPFDRKPGFVGLGYSYDNKVRYVPIERAGRERILHLIARNESLANRLLVVLRVAIYLVVVAFGAILVIVKPNLGTAAIFIYVIGGEFPTTYLDLVIPNPWRQIPEWISATLTGAARPALLVFAASLGWNVPSFRVRFAWIGAALAFGLGTLHAYAFEKLVYLGQPAAAASDLYATLSTVFTIATTIVFIVALARSRGRARQRIGWIVVSFAFAGVARLVSDAFYPAHLTPQINAILLTLAVLPIVVVWIGVVRDRLFNVDFVVSRALVYVALTAGVIGAITIIEEVGTLVFFYNSDLSYAVLIGLSVAIGAFTTRLREPIETFVDRFIFRDRRAQRKSLEAIARNVIDARSTAEVDDALLERTVNALELTFAGIYRHEADGTFAFDRGIRFPHDIAITIGASDPLVAAIAQTRSPLALDGRTAAHNGRALSDDRVAFAAPLFIEREIGAIVVYGRNVGGLDLDPDERELVVEIIAHASIALGALELARLRAAVAQTPTAVAST